MKFHSKVNRKSINPKQIELKGMVSRERMITNQQNKAIHFFLTSCIYLGECIFRENKVLVCANMICLRETGLLEILDKF